MTKRYQCRVDGCEQKKDYRAKDNRAQYGHICNRCYWTGELSDLSHYAFIAKTVAPSNSHSTFAQTVDK